MKTLSVNINGIDEQIRFSDYRITSTRSPFDLWHSLGLNDIGMLSEQFDAFTPGSIEHVLLATIQSGNLSGLDACGLVKMDRPRKGEASRSLAVFNPETFMYYTLGGIGAILPTKHKKDDFVLSNPRPDKLFRNYCKENKVDPGGTHYVTETGFSATPNPSLLGIFPYKDPERGLIRKGFLTERLKQAGINTPTYIAVGQIRNFGNGFPGFSIYQSNLTPEYLINQQLWWDQFGQLKRSYQDYIFSKYSQISSMHFRLGLSHGQLSNTNTLAELLPISDGVNTHRIVCQIKDVDTVRELPKTRDKIIRDGITMYDIGIKVEKSPYVAALINDLQLALTQELNSLHIPLTMATSAQHKMEYIKAQAPKIIHWALQAYGLNDQGEIRDVIGFSMDLLLKNLKSKHAMDFYNFILGGVAAHAIFGMSKHFCHDIRIINEPMKKDSVHIKADLA